MDNIQNITIDIMNNKYSDYIYAKQYDHNRIVNFTVTENGSEKNIDDMYCTFIMKGKSNVQFESLTRNGNTFQLIIQSRDTAEYGKIPYQLVVTTGEPVIDQEGHIHWGDSHTIIGTVTSYFLVEECVINDEDAQTQQSETVLDQLLTEIQAAEQVIDEIDAKKALCDQDVELADASATKAESWAVGGTGSRTGEDTDNSKYYSDVSKSYAVGGTTILHDGNPDTNDNAKYYYEQVNAIWSKVSYDRTITLLANSWDPITHKQIVNVPGVLPTETDQLIIVRPHQEDIEEYVRNYVICITQLQDALEFQCDTVPQNDIDVFVMLQNVDTQGTLRKSHMVVTNSINIEPDSTSINTNDFWVVRNYDEGVTP